MPTSNPSDKPAVVVKTRYPPAVTPLSTKERCRADIWRQAFSTHPRRGPRSESGLRVPSREGAVSRCSSPRDPCRRRCRSTRSDLGRHRGRSRRRGGRRRGRWPPRCRGWVRRLLRRHAGGARRSLRESKRDEARGIGPVHGGPPVGPVSRVAGDALLAGHRGDYRDEPVVAGSVHGRREAQVHGVHTAVDEIEREVLTASARRLRDVERGGIVLRGGPALGEAGDARGGRVGPVVLVREVDDGLGGLGASTDAREIVKVTAADPSPLGRQGSGGSIGPGEPRDLVSGGETRLMSATVITIHLYGSNCHH